MSLETVGWRAEEGQGGPSSHLTSGISGRRPQHSVSGPRREAAATGPMAGLAGLGDLQLIWATLRQPLTQ